MLRAIFQTMLLSLAAVLFVQPAICEHPDLSGSWQLDVAASTFGPMAVPNSGELNITPGARKTLHIQRVLKEPEGERTIDTEWRTDDRFHPVVGDEPGSLLAKWDGSVLVGKRLTGAGMEEIHLAVGADGITMIESIQSSQGTRTLVWRRR